MFLFHLHSLWELVLPSMIFNILLGHLWLQVTKNNLKCLKHSRFFLSHILKSLEVRLIQHLNTVIRSPDTCHMSVLLATACWLSVKACILMVARWLHISRNRALSQLLPKAREKTEALLMHCFLSQSEKDFPRCSLCLNGLNGSSLCRSYFRKVRDCYLAPLLCEVVSVKQQEQEGEWILWREPCE